MKEKSSDNEPGASVETGSGENDDRDLEQSTGYIRDPETGEWKIVNPAGSSGYNYLYRDY